MIDGDGSANKEGFYSQTYAKSVYALAGCDMSFEQTFPAKMMQVESLSAEHRKRSGLLVPSKNLSHLEYPLCLLRTAWKLQRNIS